MIVLSNPTQGAVDKGTDGRKENLNRASLRACFTSVFSGSATLSGIADCVGKISKAFLLEYRGERRPFSTTLTEASRMPFVPRSVRINSHQWW